MRRKVISMSYSPAILKVLLLLTFLWYVSRIICFGWSWIIQPWWCWWLDVRSRQCHWLWILGRMELEGSQGFITLLRMVCSLKLMNWPSLVAQWLRIHLPMQGTQVGALVQEDPTCHRTIKPVCYNYWACALEPVSHNYWAHMPQLLKSVCLEPVLCNKRSHCNEKPVHRNEE